LNILRTQPEAVCDFLCCFHVSDISPCGYHTHGIRIGN
jgi:hypothetical protein